MGSGGLQIKHENHTVGAALNVTLYIYPLTGSYAKYIYYGNVYVKYSTGSKLIESNFFKYTCVHIHFIIHPYLDKANNLKWREYKCIKDIILDSCVQF
jgi:hypothetical protein